MGALHKGYSVCCLFCESAAGTGFRHMILPGSQLTHNCVQAFCKTLSVQWPVVFSICLPVGHVCLLIVFSQYVWELNRRTALEHAWIC